MIYTPPPGRDDEYTRPFQSMLMYINEFSRKLMTSNDFKWIKTFRELTQPISNCNKNHHSLSWWKQTFPCAGRDITCKICGRISFALVLSRANGKLSNESLHQRGSRSLLRNLKPWRRLTNESSNGVSLSTGLHDHVATGVCDRDVGGGSSN